jgi:hypothetical protein
LTGKKKLSAIIGIIRSDIRLNACSASLKHYRRIATRYEKKAINYMGYAVVLICTFMVEMKTSTEPRHLNILNKTYAYLLKNFKDQLASALKEPTDLSLAELRATIAKKYKGLEKYTVDLQGLKAFILRLQNNKETGEAWLESIAAFLGKVPPDKWPQNNSLDARIPPYRV